MWKHSNQTLNKILSITRYTIPVIFKKVIVCSSDPFNNIWVVLPIEGKIAAQKAIRQHATTQWQWSTWQSKPLELKTNWTRALTLSPLLWKLLLHGTYRSTSKYCCRLGQDLKR